MSPIRPATQVDYQQRMLRVLVHVQQHLDEPLPLDDLAAIANFSPYHFHRIFRGMIGETVQQHIKRLRLERAAMRLRLTDRSILTIALEAGYESHEGFTRAFGSVFGCPPTEFRTSSRSSTDPATSGVHLVDDLAQLPTLVHCAREPLMNVEIKRLPEMRAAFVRHVGPYHEVGAAWQRLMDWAGELGHVDGNTQMFGTCHDDPDVTDPAMLRYDACITIGEDVKALGDIGMQIIPCGRFACVLHQGPYDTLNDTYAALFGQWFAKHRYEPGPPPCLEFYLNEPDCTPPEELLTQVCARIEE